VWAECPIRIQKSHSIATNFMSVMGSLIDKCSDEEVELAVLVARQIWHRRNNMVFGGKFTGPKILVKTASDQAGSLYSGESTYKAQGVDARRIPHTPWSKPPPGVIKVNWDAAVEGRQKRIGIGVIVRNCEGGVLAMMSESMDYIQDPTTAEALAARRAVEFSLSLGIRKIILEGDANQIVQALRCTDGGRCSYGLIIEDMQQLFRRFVEHSVQFVRREANKEAHKLAKLALSLGENKVWREDFPFSVNNDVSAV
jgi:ribonuclease HI